MATHTTPSPDRNRAQLRGFALPEVAALVVIAALGLALLIPTMNEARRQAGLGRDIANLRQIGLWTGMYAADNNGLYWTFSWEAGHKNSKWAALNSSSSKLQAAVTQAIDIIRRRTGRHSFLVSASWLPHVSFSHLVLVDYLDRSLPDLDFVSDADTNRLLWAADPLGFDQGAFLPFQPAPGFSSKKWPYSASHLLGTSFYDGSPPGARIQPMTHNTYSISLPNNVMGGQPLANVRFPSHKVHLNFAESRYFGTNLFCTTDGARLPFLMADASVQIHDAQDANASWQPNTPTSPLPTTFFYTPKMWEAPTSSGARSERVFGRFLWTRGFLAGVDFDRRAPKRPRNEKEPEK
jgi:hypothetical protein